MMLMMKWILHFLYENDGDVDEFTSSWTVHIHELYMNCICIQFAQPQFCDIQAWKCDNWHLIFIHVSICVMLTNNYMFCVKGSQRLTYSRRVNLTNNYTVWKECQIAIYSLSWWVTVERCPTKLIYSSPKVEEKRLTSTILVLLKRKQTLLSCLDIYLNRDTCAITNQTMWHIIMDMIHICRGFITSPRSIHWSCSSHYSGCALSPAMMWRSASISLRIVYWAR